VPQVVFSRQARDHFERLLEFLADEDPSAAVAARYAILSGIAVLGEHPLVGRHVAGELRELLISFGRTGYVALYRFIPSRSVVRILGFRHQRELHYPL
jgi:plasmid stabilization system protein ParE